MVRNLFLRYVSFWLAQCWPPAAVGRSGRNLRKDPRRAWKRKQIIDTLFETGCIDFRHAEQDWGLELY